MANSQEMDDLCNIDILTPIPSEAYLPIITSPPFIPSKSLINIRDSGRVPGSTLPPARFYRCGTLQLAAADPDALAWISTNVKRIFDLRKPDERAKNPDPDVEGVENVWIEGRGVYPEPELKDFVEDGGVPGWKKGLMSVVDVYAPTFRAVLEHVRDRPTEPILFHCTAGRDRTGILAGLLHNLAGSPSDAVMRDYMLSRIGTEPAREHLTQYALGTTGVESMDLPGLYELINQKPSYFSALEEGLREKYGGREGYVTSEEGLGMSQGDLETVKRNLRV
ncbi:tyrosine phosphatase family protein [Sarocladium implicatum]|nr:tyrosine phosphatase family protein [Sarocladium implicatum]